MKPIDTHARSTGVCILALAAACALPVYAGEPALLSAEELTGLPVLEDVAQLSLMAAATAEANGSETHEERHVVAIGGTSAQAIDLGQLEDERGRADTVLNDTRINGDVANNNAVNVNTGSNTIDAGSFANMSGIPVVIQNSGANVLIQNATVVNLQFQ